MYTPLPIIVFDDLQCVSKKKNNKRPKRNKNKGSTFPWTIIIETCDLYNYIVSFLKIIVSFYLWKKNNIWLPDSYVVTCFFLVLFCFFVLFCLFVLVFALVFFFWGGVWFFLFLFFAYEVTFHWFNDLQNTIWALEYWHWKFNNMCLLW